MLTDLQRDEFDRLGLLRLPAAIPPADVAAMRDRCWAFLTTRHGIDPDRPETWTVERPRHLQALHHSGAFDPMASGPVRAALDDLLGSGGWQPPKTWGAPLVTFPGPGPWTVPATGWHVDSWGPEHALPGVTVFAFLAPVAATGGGTVLLPGSHHLVNRHIAATGTWRSAATKAALAAEHPWLRELWDGATGPGRDRRPGAPSDGASPRPSGEAADPGRSERLAAGAVAGDIPLRVQELTGVPGDVVLMHSRTLHASAPNALGTPRMMVVEIVGRRR